MYVFGLANIVLSANAVNASISAKSSGLKRMRLSATANAEELSMIQQSALATVVPHDVLERRC
jgi:regulator of extracellular matrix RemA (YlzA/DUF370 family)